MENNNCAATNEYYSSLPVKFNKPINEQRREPRHRLFDTVNVAFYNNGKLYRGYIADISACGARLELPATTPDGIPDLSRGRKMECYLLNRYGRSKCRGTIQWVRNDGTVLQWGISFVEVSSEKDDPLRIIIDQPLHVRNAAPSIGIAIY
jgi:hypothetical protein